MTTEDRVTQRDETAERSALDEATASGPNGSPGPVGAGEPLTGAWRDETLRKADELHALTNWMSHQDERPRGAEQHAIAIERHLDQARATAAGEDRRPGYKRLLSPADPSAVDAALGSVDAAEAGVLRITPIDRLKAQMPSVEAQVYRYLPKSNPRQVGLDCGRGPGAPSSR